MGQKVNPVGIRLGITRDWTSRWYGEHAQLPAYILQDWQVREFLKKKLAEASVSRIHIERAARRRTSRSTRPAGRGDRQEGEDIERLRLEVAKMMAWPCRTAPQHRRDPQARGGRPARGEGIASRSSGASCPRAMKRAVMNTMRSGALGVKVRVSGRLNGSESRAPSGPARACCRCTRSAPRSTTAPPRPARPTACRREGVDLQGRGVRAAPAPAEQPEVAAPAQEQLAEASRLSTGWNTTMMHRSEPSIASSTRARTAASRSAAVPLPSATTGLKATSRARMPRARSRPRAAP